MVKSLITAFAFASAIGAASGAMAANGTVVHHPMQQRTQPTMNKVVAKPVQVITEKPNNNPSMADAFAASDGVFYFPATHDPRSHGLPNF